MKKVVIYPGRFQPMLPHHAEVYKKLQADFSDADIFVATSDKVDGKKSPFNFKEKAEIIVNHVRVWIDITLWRGFPRLEDSRGCNEQRGNVEVGVRQACGKVEVGVRQACGNVEVGVRQACGNVKVGVRQACGNVEVGVRQACGKVEVGVRQACGKVEVGVRQACGKGSRKS